MAESNGSDKEDVKSEISEKNRNNSRADYKVTNTYIIGIVHHYFCIFHSWLPTNKDEKLLLKLILCSTWSTPLLFLAFIGHEWLNRLFGRFIGFDFSVFWILVLASFLILLICLVTGYWYLAPRKIEVLQDRMKSELNTDTSNLSNLKQKNYHVAKFEIEKLWFEKVIVNTQDIQYLIDLVESNIRNRKSSSRGIDSIIQLILSNQYIINLLLVILTVTLTVSLSPLIPSITDENFFSMLSVLNLSALYFWVALVLLFVFIKILFMIFIWSIEISTQNKIFVIWRYEIFRDMLARHQKVIIKKPRIRYVPVLENKKEQEKIESESEVKVVIDIAEKVEAKNNR